MGQFKYNEIPQQLLGQRTQDVASQSDCTKYKVSGQDHGSKPSLRSWHNKSRSQTEKTTIQCDYWNVSEERHAGDEECR